MDDKNIYDAGNDERKENEQNVYTVGSDNGGSTPPPDYRSGEYSFKGGDSIPEYRYTYTNQSSSYGSGASSSQQQSGETPKKAKRPKKQKKPRQTRQTHRTHGRRSHTALIVALVVVAAMLMCALAGIGGAMIVRLYDAGSNPSDTQNPGYSSNVPDTPDNSGSDSRGDDPSSGAQSSGNSDVVIIKNNDSVTVKTVGGKIGDESLTVPDVVSLVKDSVVEIFTEQRSYNGWYVSSGAGSGVFIGKSEDGKHAYLVTNNHVIDGADTINVRTTDGTRYVATLIGTDSVTDVAVLSVEATGDITVAECGSSAGLVVGEGVIAIGNPLGELGGTVTTGIVSALEREVTIDDNKMVLLQTNAAVNPGNSGGGLFNMKGELIGVVNAKSSGDSVENIGFAIPIDTAYSIVVELLEHGYVTGRPTTGLTLIDITDRFTAMYYGLDSLGVYVTESKFTDEIRNGDRIVSINGTNVSSEAEVKSLLDDLKVGDKVSIVIARKGVQHEVELTLQENVPDQNS